MAQNGGTLVAVGAAKSALPAPLLDSHTRAVGVIVPPPDIRCAVMAAAAAGRRHGAPAPLAITPLRL